MKQWRFGLPVLPRQIVAAVAMSASAAVVLVVAPGRVAAGPVLPAFSPSNFTPGAPIDNPYFPVKPGTVFRAAGEVTDPDTGQKGFEVDEDRVTFQTETVGGVQARVVHARSFLDGVLIESTTDLYAQDKSGNVWYLGESTSAFEFDDNGRVIGADHTGSWRTGVHGGLPGFIMPAHPQVGFEYYQEFAPADQAVDQAKIVSVDGTLTVPVGTFSNVLKTQETTAVEPGVVEFKLYGRGAGVLLTQENLDDAGVPRNNIALQSISSVPLPPAAWPGLAGLAAVAAATGPALRRARRRGA